MGECSLEEAISRIETAAPTPDGGDRVPIANGGGSACALDHDGSSNTIYLPHRSSDPGVVTVYKVKETQRISTNITIVGESDDRVRIEGSSTGSVFEVRPE